MQPNVVLDGHTIEPTRPEQTKSATEEKSLPPSAGLFWRALALSSTACVAWLHACAGRGRRAFKQSVSPSAVDGGRDAQLGRRWFEVSGEKERDPKKKTAAWPFCLARCACCPLFDLSSSSVSTVRHARTHGTHRDARWLAGKARWLTGPRVGTSFRSPGHARAMRVTVAAARPTTCLFLAAVPGAVVFPR